MVDDERSSPAPSSAMAAATWLKQRRMKKRFWRRGDRPIALHPVVATKSTGVSGGGSASPSISSASAKYGRESAAIVTDTWAGEARAGTAHSECRVGRKDRVQVGADCEGGGVHGASAAPDHIARMWSAADIREAEGGELARDPRCAPRLVASGRRDFRDGDLGTKDVFVAGSEAIARIR